MTLSMVISTFNYARWQPIIEENGLLEFTVDSGRLIICHIYEEFHVSLTTQLPEFNVTFNIDLRLEDRELPSGSAPEQQDPPSYVFPATGPTSSYTWCFFWTSLPNLLSSLRTRTGLRSQQDRTSSDTAIRAWSYCWRSTGEPLLYTWNNSSRISYPPRTGFSWNLCTYIFSHLSHAFTFYHSTTITTILVFIASCLLWC